MANKNFNFQKVSEAGKTNVKTLSSTLETIQESIPEKIKEERKAVQINMPLSLYKRMAFCKVNTGMNISKIMMEALEMWLDRKG